MTKKILLFVLAVMPICLQAQVTISAQVPPAGFVQKDQLWNLVLVNNNDNLQDVHIKMSLQDVSGQVVLAGNSGNFIMGKGVKIVTVRDIQPVLYNFNVPDMQRNYLPMGKYVMCYQVVANTPKQEPLGEECMRINIDPLSPPLLSSPADKAIVQTPYPQFTWMPPSPFDMFTDLQYDLVVTEVLPGQSAVESVEYNTPVYARGNLKQPFESYANSFTKLDTGKTYAWQVIARNGLNYAAKTEVWTFSLAKPVIPEEVINNSPYVRLKLNDPDKSIAANGILRISYENRTGEKSVKIYVSELGNDGKKAGAFFEAPLVAGENSISYDLKKIIDVKEGHVYLAQLVNEANEVWLLRFEIKTYR